MSGLAKRISWSVAEKYESRWNPSSELRTSFQISGRSPPPGAGRRAAREIDGRGEQDMRACAGRVTIGVPFAAIARTSSGSYSGIPAEPTWVSTSMPASNALRTSFSS
jgi:hypothetical protein